MENNFASNCCLHYTTLEFQSETQAKATFTFWDKIYRQKWLIQQEIFKIGIVKNQIIIQM